MRRWIAVLIAFVLAASGCSKGPISTDTDGQQSADHISFGHFYGMCVGEACVEIYKLTDRQLFEDTLDIYPSSDKSYEGQFIPLHDSLFQMVRSLRDEIPAELLQAESKVFGMPDAGDWGGIYFEWSEDGETRHWSIDKMRANNPDYLNPFVDKIEAAISKLSAR